LDAWSLALKEPSILFMYPI